MKGNHCFLDVYCGSFDFFGKHQETTRLSSPPVPCTTCPERIDRDVYIHIYAHNVYIYVYQVPNPEPKEPKLKEPKPEPREPKEPKPEPKERKPGT